MRTLILTVLFLAYPAFADFDEDLAAADAYLEAEDYKKAFKAFRSLAKKGDHYSQYRVSQLYADGKGVRGDMLDAYAWSVLAAESGGKAEILHSETLLADVEDQADARKEADKLLKKYGKMALEEKAARDLARGSGSCTGSRMGCR